MKKPKLTKRQQDKRRRRQALDDCRDVLEELVPRLRALGDFDANAGHIRAIAAALLVLYRDRLEG